MLTYSDGMSCQRLTLSLAGLACLVLLSAPALGAGKGVLRAGASRVDITPEEGASLRMSGYGSRTDGFQGIHDRLHVRAIVVEDGTTQAAIVTCDLIFVLPELWASYSARIADETGIPRENILLAATHTHAAPNIRALSKMVDNAKARGYMRDLEARTVKAVREAQSTLRPARIGFGTGEAHVNMNRRAPSADGGWRLGNNPTGPSDKTLAVIRFETLDGEPLAFLINHAVHGTVLGPKNLEISADLPGAASRHVEKHFGDKVVAVFTAGCSGDQDPIYRVGTNFEELAALGRILGDEVVRVAPLIRTSPHMSIRGAQRVVTCPGKKLPPGPRRRKSNEYVFLDDDPVDIRISLLMLNHIAITGVSGEVLTMIGTRLKDESPFANTIVVTHANGSSGYIPDDAAYDQVSYEIISSRVKRGCAEDAIVNGLLDMMDAL